MAREAMGLHLFGLEEEGEQIPLPSKPGALMARLGEGQSVVLLEVWMPPVRGGIENKAVKKTLTIPKWLNDLAERQGVNFSQVLQDSLKVYLGITPRPSAPPADAETLATAEPIRKGYRALETLAEGPHEYGGPRRGSRRPPK